MIIRWENTNAGISNLGTDVNPFLPRINNADTYLINNIVIIFIVVNIMTIIKHGFI